MRLIYCLFGFLVSGNDVHEDEEFVVYPGGEEHSFSKSMGEFKCTYTYITQGGTNEAWKMVVGRNQDGSGYSCTVSRENQMTYLFTETFTLKIEGASIEHYVVYGNEERRLLTPETRQRGKSLVESTDDFGHEVAKISVIGRAKKTDL